jgi:hypothetical protein
MLFGNQKSKGEEERWGTNDADLSLEKFLMDVCFYREPAPSPQQYSKLYLIGIFFLMGWYARSSKRLCIRNLFSLTLRAQFSYFCLNFVHF